MFLYMMYEQIVLEMNKDYLACFSLCQILYLYYVLWAFASWRWRWKNRRL